jgi:hypothetical protein
VPNQGKSPFFLLKPVFAIVCLVRQIRRDMRIGPVEVRFFGLEF